MFLYFLLHYSKLPIQHPCENKRVRRNFDTKIVLQQNKITCCTVGIFRFFFRLIKKNRFVAHTSKQLYLENV